MKHLFILPFIAMLIVFNVGCSLLVNNQEKATKTTVESQEIQKNETTEANSRLNVAKQALSSGDYNKVPLLMVQASLTLETKILPSPK